MRNDVERALDIDATSSIESRTIDITTIGRTTGEPRRIEICFYRFEGETYLSGIPSSTPRGWLRNLAAHPQFTFHFKNHIHVDLTATASVISDPTERRRILTKFGEEFNLRNDPDQRWPTANIDEWIADSPLARVDFAESE